MKNAPTDCLGHWYAGPTAEDRKPAGFSALLRIMISYPQPSMDGVTRSCCITKRWRHRRMQFDSGSSPVSITVKTHEINFLMKQVQTSAWFPLHFFIPNTKMFVPRLKIVFFLSTFFHPTLLNYLDSPGITRVSLHFTVKFTKMAFAQKRWVTGTNWFKWSRWLPASARGYCCVNTSGTLHHSAFYSCCTLDVFCIPSTLSLHPGDLFTS